MNIENLEVSLQVKEVLSKSGYRELYPTQAEAIKKGALAGERLILASPTASGKTLIAELCALKHILERNGKVIYLAPLRALASEKYEDFKKYTRLRKPNGEMIRVTISTGDYDSNDLYLKRFDLIVATNEKVDSLLRHGARWMADLSLVIVDEVHLIQDPDRGPTLEVALSRLRQINPKIQVLALSATIENVEEIAEWLNARYAVMDWRPVPLREGVLLYDEIQFKDGGSRIVSRSHSNQAINIASETIQENGQALIFAETRRTAVTLAQKAAPVVRKLISKSEFRSLKGASNEILATGERTKLSEEIAQLIENGVAAHHAGIHSAHRRIVEKNFRKGLIKLLVATPTLAAGVNLPARTVIIHSHMRYEPGYGRMEIPILEYKQMAGRAGRPRYDKVGDAVLIASTPDDREYLMERYICSKPEQIWSKLGVERILRTHVLAAIASGFTHSEQALFDFFSHTFYAHQYGENMIRDPVYDALNYLSENQMIKCSGSNVAATTFGRRVSELYINPQTGVLLREGLNGKSEASSDLTLLHLVSHTPDISPKLYPYRKEVEDLQLFLEEHHDELLFNPPDMWVNPLEYEQFLGELKCAMVLMQWVEETKENDLLKNFRVEPGDLYRLVERAEWLLYAAQELAKLFKCISLLPQLGELRVRVKYGVKRELLNLVSLEGVGRIRARALYSDGYKTIADIKHASISELTSLPTFGYKLALKIKEQAGGTVQKKDIQSEGLEKDEVQSSLERYTPTNE